MNDQGGNILEVAVHMMEKRTRLNYLDIDCTRNLQLKSTWGVAAVVIPVHLQYSKDINTFFDSHFLFLCSIVLGLGSIVGSKFFTKKEESKTRITARCGAVCSDCSYFVEGDCPSCPEGDPALQERCAIFKCAREKGITCHVCDELLRCKIFAQEREACPFEEEYFPLETGLGYVVYEKTPEQSIQLFKDYVNRGEFGLVVSRQYPEQMKTKHNIKNVATVWLSTAEGENNWIDPCNLSKLHHVIADFIRHAPVSTVLFEGLEYLMVRNSFLTALKFVQSLMDEITLKRSRLLLSINPDAFEKKELALIRRELIEL